MTFLTSTDRIVRDHMAPALGYIGLAIGLVVLIIAIARSFAKAGAERAVPAEVESAPAESTGPNLPVSVAVPSGVTIEEMKPVRPSPNSVASPIAQGPSGLPNVGAFLEEAASSRPSGAIQESTQVMSAPPPHDVLPETPVVPVVPIMPVMPVKATLASNEMATAAAQAIAIVESAPLVSPPVVNLSKATLASNEMAAAQAIALDRNPVKATLPSHQPLGPAPSAKSTLPSGFRPELPSPKPAADSAAPLDPTRMLAAAALGLLEAGDIEGAKRLLRRALSDGG